MKKYKNIIVHALLTYFSLGAYFLIVEGLGFADQTYLRLFNGVIVLFFMNRLIKTNVKDNINTYLENFSSSFLSAAMAVVLSALSLIAFLGLKGDAYVAEIASSLLLVNANTPAQIGGAILIEGLASSMMFAFVSMQYWKGSFLGNEAT